MKNNELKYFAYCRKSSEDSQRQVASIGDQMSALKTLAEHEGITLVKSFTEERSAKDPGRPVFNEMLNLIEKGEADGIVCWAINRLYRNPVDEGRLRWMLQKSIIRIIKTPSREFYPDDAGLLMGVEGGQATDYVIRLSKDVKRGLNSKVMKGWRPSPAPTGYINIGEVGDKTITADPERFEIVRKIWDLYLSGTYSVSKIRDIATKKWGLRTFPRRKQGGQPLTMSHMYAMLTDPFYYGYFLWNDPETGERKLFKGNHPAMITEKEYNRAQVLLGKKGKPRPQTREFAFTGLMRCGECNSMITAEMKNQIICSACKNKFSYENKTACPKCQTEISEMVNPKILNYTYYHCTKKKNRNCSQVSIRVEDLEKQFSAKLMELRIDPDYLQVALDYLADKQKDSGKEEGQIRLSLQAGYDNCVTRLKNLNREYTSPQNLDYGLYTPEEFKAQKAIIIQERDLLLKQLNEVSANFDDSLKETERIFNFCAFAHYHFNTDNLQKKRDIFSTIGSNLTLKDKKLNIELLHPYLLIQNELIDQRKLYEGLEPEKEGYEERRKAIFVASIPSWLRDQGSNLGHSP